MAEGRDAKLYDGESSRFLCPTEAAKTIAALSPYSYITIIIIIVLVHLYNDVYNDERVV